MRRLAVILVVLGALLVATIALGQTWPNHSLPANSLPTFAVPELVEEGGEPEPPAVAKGGLRNGRWMSRRR